MNNIQEQLKSYASSSQSLISFMENSENIWAIKSLESQYIYINKPALNIGKIPMDFNYEGKFDTEIPVDIFQELGEDFKKHDQEAIKANKVISEINLHNWNNSTGIGALLCEKHPFYDKNKNIVGLICYARKLDAPSLLLYMNKFNKNSIQFDAPSELFTKRELDVIFWAQQRLSAKEIAKRLNIAPNTIESYLQIIYQKANVTALSQLIEYCKNHGYDTYIPSDFISKGTTLI